MTDQYTYQMTLREFDTYTPNSEHKGRQLFSKWNSCSYTQIMRRYTWTGPSQLQTLPSALSDIATIFKIGLSCLEQRLASAAKESQNGKYTTLVANSGATDPLLFPRWFHMILGILDCQLTVAK